MKRRKFLVTATYAQIVVLRNQILFRYCTSCSRVSEIYAIFRSRYRPVLLHIFRIECLVRRYPSTLLKQTTYSGKSMPLSIPEQMLASGLNRVRWQFIAGITPPRHSPISLTSILVTPPRKHFITSIYCRTNTPLPMMVKPTFSSLQNYRGEDKVCMRNRPRPNM